MYQLISLILQPFSLLFVLTLLACANLWRARTEKRSRLLLLTLPLLGLTTLCMPPVGYLALGSLEWQYPLQREYPTDVGAIVVLAGGIIPPDQVQRRAELTSSTLYRCLHAREIYQEAIRRPILVSGGQVDPSEPGPSHAEAMRDFLVELGVSPADLIVEDRSRTTYENGVESAKLLRQRGVRRVILVTDATHMIRAVGVFRKQGIDPIPSGSRYRATNYDFSLSDLVPDFSTAHACQEAFHEWLGILWYRLSGKM
jgi:uncharacterized SAM-binding protein YcdF (DUF218 family)